MLMCSYNLINGDWGCENDYTLNQVLKKEWGFQGWVVSDWFATHTTVKAALAGLDMEQPTSRYFGAALKKAIEGGQVPVERLDDMVRRIVRTEFASGIFDNPQPTPGAGCAARIQSGATHGGRIHGSAEERQGAVAAERGRTQIDCHHRRSCRCGSAFRRRIGAGRSRGRKRRTRSEIRA
jgi:beta-glucosidase-like glycosyl hydrolase